MTILIILAIVAFIYCGIAAVIALIAFMALLFNYAFPLEPKEFWTLVGLIAFWPIGIPIMIYVIVILCFGRARRPPLPGFLSAETIRL